MQRHLMKSKIHRATITSADLHYEGSLTVDEDLLDAADLVTYEEVQVVNVNNGSRFTTYVIPGLRGSGTIQLNGAAARLGCSRKYSASLPSSPLPASSSFANAGESSAGGTISTSAFIAAFAVYSGIRFAASRSAGTAGFARAPSSRRPVRSCATGP